MKTTITLRVEIDVSRVLAEFPDKVDSPREAREFIEHDLRVELLNHRLSSDGIIEILPR